MNVQIEVPVAGGMCKLLFRPGCSTGGADTNPGVGFDYVSEVQLLANKNNFYGGMGVIGRKDAAVLRDMLNEFLRKHPV